LWRDFPIMTMLPNPAVKYRPYAPFNLPNRTWPNRQLKTAPLWLSTDLRDGNQALIDPMDATKKMRLFKCLVDVGFKEIEVGFPSASQTEFDFVRELIEGGHIPNDVRIQVLTQARNDLIVRTFEALKGAKKATVHYYNAIAPSFREIVFKQDKDGVKKIAIDGGKTIKCLAEQYPETNWQFEYSPEVFSSSELDLALDVCNAVIDVFNPTKTNKLILNLPATIECATPNHYADQIEFFSTNINNRDSLIISLHAHNDRGTAIAATELALMAGGDRVEGCLFGNGERTGNVCLLTLALNLYTQGVNPKLDFSDIDAVQKVVEECTQIAVHPRYPYAGDLVHTAFSGSHQDAIRKGFALQKEGEIWRVPYLPIDPRDIGRDYEAVIRVNSQSGKGGISFLLEQEYGIHLPRKAQIEFSRIVQNEADKSGIEVSAAQIYALLESEYLQLNTPFSLIYHSLHEEYGQSSVEVEVKNNNETLVWQGVGNGPLEALVAAIPHKLEIMDYQEHAIGAGTNAKAAAFIELKVENSKPIFGIVIDENITTASFKALLCGLNRYLKNQQ